MKCIDKLFLLALILLSYSSTVHAQVGIGTTSPSEVLDLESSSATKTALDINCTGAGDPMIHFQISGTAAFTMGVDNSDGDKFKIGTTAVETGTSVTIDASGNVGVGIATPVSTLDIAGSLGYKVTSITAATTLDQTHNVVLASDAGGSFTVTLPAAASNTGKTYYVKKTNSSTNLITIDGNGAETIDGATTLVLYLQYDAVRIISDGSNWHVIENKITRHAAILQRAAAQSISTATSTKIAFDGEVYDYGSIADYTTNDRIDIKRAGRYLVTGAWRPVGSIDDGELVSVTIYVNGSAVSDHFNMSSAADKEIAALTTITLDLAVNDYVELYVYHNEGGSQNTSTTFTYYYPMLQVLELR